MTTTDIFHQGQEFFIDGHFEESIDSFTKAHDLGYSPARTYLSRGVAYLRSKQFDKAIDDFCAVLALEPDNERGFYYRGISFLATEALEQADGVKNKAAELVGIKRTTLIEKLKKRGLLEK